MTPQRLPLFVALALLVVTGATLGCAPRMARLPEPTDPAAAWAAMRRDSCAPPARPAMLAKGSLYYTRVLPARRTNRTQFTMWGDFHGPMRLDVSAGIGTSLAHIREDGDGLTIFHPEQKTAYTHADPVLGATRLGMPFPFSLAQLARVCAGDFAGLVPETYEQAEPGNNGFTYAVTHRLAHADGQAGTTDVRRIGLDRAGRPVLIEGTVAAAPDEGSAEARQTGGPLRRFWRLEINTYEKVASRPPLPGRLTLAMDDGEAGVLRITAREFKVAPWPPRATGLELPEGTRVYRLDGAAAPQEPGTPATHED
ncbi:hypothetical protein GKC30_07265 [Pseudodesulfovibrio sp. F-1]|uniref:DUF4292 domain-containing protein n=1 Tax=Pseudodesulfovibrio alkaliphilus TaxID=2661613 RepID=A0A7K1KMX6_9BACT|nr:hypothetical protein [Pseudodesulfovibrio alkaliphilus]MUM77425.1 hypothetical protein [Pseudodesulfovibrio alkaliphilus]